MLRTSIDKLTEKGFKLKKERSRRYPAQIITDADYTDDIALLANAPASAKTLLHSLERAAAGIGLHVNAHKTEHMYFNQTGSISTLNGSFLKLVDKFNYQGSSVSSTETDINMRPAKARTAIDRLSVIWKSDLTDKMKRSFFLVVVSIPLYGCTSWTLTKRMEKKLDGNYTKMLRAILNKSRRQHPTEQQLYSHLPPITKTIRVRRKRRVGHCWRSRDAHIRDVLLWTPLYGRAKAGRPARTYIQQLCPDTGFNREELPEAMGDRECGERGSGKPVLMAWRDDNDIIIIMMSCRQHGYPWPSLATSPYHSSPPAGLQGYILCPPIVAVCKFELVVMLLHGHWTLTDKQVLDLSEPGRHGSEKVFCTP